MKIILHYIILAPHMLMREGDEFFHAGGWHPVLTALGHPAFRLSTTTNDIRRPVYA